MPRLVNTVPKYRKHRASGQAVVTISQRDHYHGTRASKIAYDRLIGEWLANDRRAPAADTQPTVLNLVAAFWRHAHQHYVKNGRPTCEQAGMKVVLRYLKEMYGDTLVADFTPASLKTIRAKMVTAGNSRGYVNQNVSRIKRIFKWGVGELLVPETVYRTIATLAGLQKGKSDARDSERVRPVADSVVEATISQLPPVVADMVRLQKFTGMRPGEVVLLRPSDVERSEPVWRYVPCEHKMQHKSGLTRTIMIGPQGQAVLLPYLLRDAEAHCFTNLAREAPCRHHYPGGSVECCRCLVQRQRPAPKTWWVGFRNISFRGLLGAHSRFGLPGR